jgi:uncharacterized Zn-binding protein involved in type VI secretion
MGRPAARINDPVAHPIPPLLSPGPGSPNVLIGGMPAWRGLVDIHNCGTPSGPTAPPHGPGTVIDGSSTVLINGSPACCMGCTIMEAVGPPNKIVGGCPTVLIGGC